jgi:uncharacterized protein
LGTEMIYHDQGQGDLGARMAAAFQNSFDSGIDKVAIIGTDCPDLKAEIMSKAFDELDRSDLVLGPAQDGGYYLIGLRRSLPELFEGINWGTDEVLAQTRTITQNLGLNIAELPTLTDIDRPEDLFDLDMNILQ